MMLLIYCYVCLVKLFELILMRGGQRGFVRNRLRNRLFLKGFDGGLRFLIMPLDFDLIGVRLLC